jgi:MHS family alpha-ketoglutarate permease-like MFS transporter
MTLSVLLMSFGSLTIALTPSYSQIGIAAPILLLLARLLQGLSVGGEYGTAATYLSEMATSKRRGFFSSFQYVTLIGGQLIAVGIQLLMQYVFFTAEQLSAWAWRIPFVIGALLAVTAFYLRRNMEETEAFRHTNNKPAAKKGSLRELFHHPKAVLTVAGLTLGGTLAFYTYTTYMQKFLVNTVHLARKKRPS